MTNVGFCLIVPILVLVQFLLSLGSRQSPKSWKPVIVVVLGVVLLFAPPPSLR